MVDGAVGAPLESSAAFTLESLQCARSKTCSVFIHGLHSALWRAVAYFLLVLKCCLSATEIPPPETSLFGQVCRAICANMTHATHTARAPWTWRKDNTTVWVLPLVLSFFSNSELAGICAGLIFLPHGRLIFIFSQQPTPQSATVKMELSCQKL